MGIIYWILLIFLDIVRIVCFFFQLYLVQESCPMKIIFLSFMQCLKASGI